MTASIPTLEELLADLEELSEVEGIDPDVPVADLGIDSLDLLEWTFVIEEKTGLDIDESSVTELEADSTLRQIYALIEAAIQASAVQ